jgi:tartrate-resistant acid phosphatase type 5
MRLNGLFFGAILLVACGGSSTANEEDGVRTDTGSSSQDDTGSSTDEDTGSSSTDDTGSSTGSDSTTTDSSSTTTDDGPGGTDTPVSGEVLRFVAMGDTGEGNDGQKKVADAIAAKCAKDGCDFVQLLGDNIYNNGVTSTTDPQWSTKFETPYGGISLPFYAVLGNHDYGGTPEGTGNDFAKGQHEVDYTKVSMKWKMPASHWGRSQKGVDMFGLDTNLIMWSRDIDKQKASFNTWKAAAKGTWKIAFGHHPYLSNGPHGNAGNYEGLSFVPITNGKTVKDFMDSTVCGNVDVYICGHDHSRQWLKSTCKGTELIVSGAGAKETEFKGSNATYFQSLTLGFLYVTIAGNKFTGEWVDLTGKSDFTRTLTK